MNANRAVSSGILIRELLDLESPKPGASTLSTEQLHWMITGLMDHLIHERQSLGDFMQWFHQQTRQKEIQDLYSRLTALTQRTIGELYQDLDYQGDDELGITYRFLTGYDNLISATTPHPYDQLQQALERGDYIPERQRRYYL